MNIFKTITNYQQFQIFLLGIFSGMPLTIIYSTLAAWMKHAEIDIAIITSFAVARIFYSLKFCWAPFVDQIKLPIIYKIGQRKSWMCFTGIIICAIFGAYSTCDITDHLSKVYVLTILLGVTSATLDIAVDAFRIDTIAQEEQSIASANAVSGYLLGGLISGAAALYISEEYSWKHAFMMISCLYILGIIFILTLKEPKIVRKEFQVNNIESWRRMIIDPFTDFLRRKGAITILLFLIFFKLGDAMLGVVSTPFYMDIGFSRKEIAGVVKTFGLIALLFGAYIGGVVTYRWGHFKSLLLAGILQGVTNFAFIFLHHIGHDINALFLTISAENIASGMGNAALVGYLAYLCNKQFSATQYALFTSASGLFSHTIVAFGGQLVKILGWDLYFAMTVFLAIPGIVLLTYLYKKYGVSKPNPIK